VLEKRVAKIRGREVREKIVIEKSWKNVCYRNVGEECWKYWCKKCLVYQFYCVFSLYLIFAEFHCFKRCCGCTCILVLAVVSHGVTELSGR